MPLADAAAQPLLLISRPAVFVLTWVVAVSAACGHDSDDRNGDDVQHADAWDVGLDRDVRHDDAGDDASDAAADADGGARVFGVTHATAKIRPGDPLPDTTHVSLDAARNEFEPFQVAVAGGAGGRTIEVASIGALVGPGGERIGPEQTVIYRVGLFDVPSAANLDGAAGPTPDPLVPAVDPHFGQERAAFPIDVPPGEVRAVWFDLHVPPDAAPGAYDGSAVLTIDGEEHAVSVSLRVRSFALPSTASLRTAFGLRWDAACVAHHGDYDTCGGDQGVERLNTRYAAEALDHRVSIERTIYWVRPDDGYASFDRLYAPFLDGEAAPRLDGAKLTTMRFRTRTIEENPEIRSFVAERGWDETTRFFYYTCDEPPAGCGWDELEARAAVARDAGLPSLVTIPIEQARAQGVLDDIDILVPHFAAIAPWRDPVERDAYQQWLEDGPDRELWWYQSCDTHGCGRACETTTEAWYHGLPSYAIDARPVQARAMEWFSFLYRMHGELYHDTVAMLETAWTEQCRHSGAGDGTLFYPGTPERIGGTEHIPLPSVRMKLIREGMEDFEYLQLLATLGDESFARQVATALFPAPWEVADQPAEALYEARRQLADRIEELSR